MECLYWAREIISPNVSFNDIDFLWNADENRDSMKESGQYTNIIYFRLPGHQHTSDLARCDQAKYWKSLDAQCGEVGYHGHKVCPFLV